MRDARERVVVTGLGAISPLGLDVASTWQGLIEGHSGVGPLTGLDCTDWPTRIAANVKGFDASRYMPMKEARRLSVFIQYALAAAAEAVEQSGLDFASEDTTRAGVEIGSALGGVSVLEEQRMLLEHKGPRGTNPSMLPAIIINTAACAVSIRYGLHGPVAAPVAACATGAMAIGEASRRLWAGEADVMIAGGTESVMTALAITAFARLGALSTRNDEPARACSPFSLGRDGTVVGEGAGVLVLETLSHAEARGAEILAELTGYGLTSDAHHLVVPDPTGASASRAMRIALSGSPTVSHDAGWIVAHGTGTQLNDAAETRAIKTALGDRAYSVPITSIKGALGHMMGAAGAISAVAAVQALRTGVLAPTINYTDPDPECDLDYVPNAAREIPLEWSMAQAFGFGGQNAAVAFRRWA